MEKAFPLMKNKDCKFSSQEPSKKGIKNGMNVNNTGDSPIKHSDIEDVVPTREK